MSRNIAIKPGVSFAVVAPAGFLILLALKKAADKLNTGLMITSGCDGLHSGPMDPHHTGEAYDVRSHDLDPAIKTQVVDAVMTELGWEHFFGFLEAPGTPDEHFHFQRKRATTMTVEDFLAL